MNIRILSKGSPLRKILSPSFPFRLTSSSSSINRSSIHTSNFGGGPPPIKEHFTPPYNPNPSAPPASSPDPEHLIGQGISVEEEVEGHSVYYSSNPETGELEATATTEGGNQGFSRLRYELKTTLLPVGYPESVSPGYNKYHGWQIVEGIAQSTQVVISMQAMLLGLGIGSPTAAAGGAVLQFVAKDGFGEIGKIIFGSKYTASFDARPKSWRFMGELWYITAGFLELLTVYAPPSAFFFLASAASACKGANSLTWSASRATFGNFFAKRENIGDITAKMESQSVLAYLSGIALGVGFSALCDQSFSALFIGYVALSPIYAFATYNSVRAVALNTFNDMRAVQVISDYAAHISLAPSSSPSSTVAASIPTPEDINKTEKLIDEWIQQPKKGAPRIRLGVRIVDAFKTESELSSIAVLLKEEKYLLSLNTHPQDLIPRRKPILSSLFASKPADSAGGVVIGNPCYLPFGEPAVSIVVHRDAVGQDLIKAVLHATIVHRMISESESYSQRYKEDESLRIELMRASHEILCAEFPEMLQLLESRGWDTRQLTWTDTGARAFWQMEESATLLQPMEVVSAAAEATAFVADSLISGVGAGVGVQPTVVASGTAVAGRLISGTTPAGGVPVVVIKQKGKPRLIRKQVKVSKDKGFRKRINALYDLLFSSGTSTQQDSKKSSKSVEESKNE